MRVIILVLSIISTASGDEECKKRPGKFNEMSNSDIRRGT